MPPGWKHTAQVGVEKKKVNVYHGERTKRKVKNDDYLTVNGCVLVIVYMYSRCRTEDLRSV